MNIILNIFQIFIKNIFKMINSYSGLDYSLEKYVKILSIEDILKDLTIEKSY